MLRGAWKSMASNMASSLATGAKRVPIPRNGVDYRGKVVLAPMVRSGELPSRLTALHYGADLVWGPETIDRALIGCTRKEDPTTGTVVFTRMPSNAQHKAKEDARESVVYRLHPEKERGKLIYQMGSASPELAVQAGKLIAADVAGIDLNSGCPKPFSTSGGMGAALLRTPDLLCSILTSLVKEVGNVFEIGISVKIRLLETPELTRALVERLVQTGITGLTIHCRTTPMRPRERAIREQLKMIGEICRDAGVACLMNGDVTSRDEALKLAEEYGVDGGMIATAAESNLSVFRPEADGGKASWQEVVHEYMRNAISVDNKFGNTKFMLNQLIPGKQLAHREINQDGKTCELIVSMLSHGELLRDARATDRRLGLIERLTAAQRAKYSNRMSLKAWKAKRAEAERNGKSLSQRGVDAVKSKVVAGDEQNVAPPLAAV